MGLVYKTFMKRLSDVSTYTWKTTPLPMKLRLKILASGSVNVIFGIIPVRVDKSTWQKVEARGRSVLARRISYLFMRTCKILHWHFREGVEYQLK
jgi:hypothetical protein